MIRPNGDKTRSLSVSRQAGQVGRLAVCAQRGNSCGTHTRVNADARACLAARKLVGAQFRRRTRARGETSKKRAEHKATRTGTRSIRDEKQRKRDGEGQRGDEEGNEGTRKLGSWNRKRKRNDEGEG